MLQPIALNPNFFNHFSHITNVDFCACLAGGNSPLSKLQGYFIYFLYLLMPAVHYLLRYR